MKHQSWLFTHNPSSCPSKSSSPSPGLVASAWIFSSCQQKSIMWFQHFFQISACSTAQQKIAQSNTNVQQRAIGKDKPWRGFSCRVNRLPPQRILLSERQTSHEEFSRRWSHRGVLGCWTPSLASPAPPALLWIPCSGHPLCRAEPGRDGQWQKLLSTLVRMK